MKTYQGCPRQLREYLPNLQKGFPELGYRATIDVALVTSTSRRCPTIFKVSLPPLFQGHTHLTAFKAINGANFLICQAKLHEMATSLNLRLAMVFLLLEVVLASSSLSQEPTTNTPTSKRPRKHSIISRCFYNEEYWQNQRRPRFRPSYIYPRPWQGPSVININNHFNVNAQVNNQNQYNNLNAANSGNNRVPKIPPPNFHPNRRGSGYYPNHIYNRYEY